MKFSENFVNDDEENVKEEKNFSLSRTKQNCGK